MKILSPKIFMRYFVITIFSVLLSSFFYHTISLNVGAAVWGGATQIVEQPIIGFSPVLLADGSYVTLVSGEFRYYAANGDLLKLIPNASNYCNNPSGMKLRSDGSILIGCNIDGNSFGRWYVLDRNLTSVTYMNEAVGTYTGGGSGCWTHNPSSFDLDAAGNIYFIDSCLRQIEKYNASNTGYIAASTNNLAESPFRMDIGNDNMLYYAGASGHIFRCTLSFSCTQITGITSYTPTVQVDSQGNIYVTEYNSGYHAIKKYNSFGVFVSNVVDFPSQYYMSWEFSIDSLDRIRVSYNENGSLPNANHYTRLYDTNGNLVFTFPDTQATNLLSVTSPRLEIDTVNNRIFAFDNQYAGGSYQYSYDIFDFNGNHLGSPVTSYAWLIDTDIDNSGNLYFSTGYIYGQYPVYKHTGTGGSMTPTTITAGPGFSPVSMIVNASGNLVYAYNDAGNLRIATYTPSMEYQSSFTYSNSATLMGSYLNDDVILLANDNTIRRYNSVGTLIWSTAIPASCETNFEKQNGYFHVLCTNTYYRYNSNGVLDLTLNVPSGSYDGQMYSTRRFVVSNNVLFVTDASGRIQKFQIVNQLTLVSGLKAYSGNLQIDSSSYTGVTGSSVPSMIKINTGTVPVVSVVVNMSSDRDWTTVTAGSDLVTGKAFVLNLNPTDAPGANATHSLYVPKLSGQTAVYICPNATQLSEVYKGCPGGYTLSQGAPNLSIVNVGGQDFWLVDGLTGTGALGLSLFGSSTFTIIPNTSAVLTTQEVILSYTLQTGFASGDKVRFTFENSAGFVLSNTCATPTTDADGNSTIDGNATIVGTNSEIYQYQFTDAVQDGSTLSFCVNVTSPATQGSYSIGLSDDNGSYGATMYYVGGDNSMFVIANVSPTLSFNIRTADDAADTNTCALGTMSTIPGADTVEGFESVSFPPSDWSTGGITNWSRDTLVMNSGSASAGSGDINDSQESWLKYDIDLTADTTLSFDWKVSSELDYDYLSFCIDNASCGRYSYDQQITGDVDWASISAPVTAGLHTFTWVYTKDGSVSEGSDMGWIDNITLGGIPPISGLCSYGLAVGTNAVQGYTTQIVADGPLNNANASIADIVTGQPFVGGRESYGLTSLTSSTKGRNSITGLYDQSSSFLGVFTNSTVSLPYTATDFVTSPVATQYLAGGDSTDLVGITHKLNIGSGTPAGYYDQVVTYTTTANF